MQPLGRDVELDSRATVVRNGERGFETEEGLILHSDFVGSFDHDLAGNRRISVNDSLVPEDVSFGMDRGG